MAHRPSAHLPKNLQNTCKPAIVRYMIMNYTLGLILGFAHGLLAAYIVIVITKKRKEEADMFLDDFDVDNQRPVFLRELPDNLF